MQPELIGGRYRVQVPIGQGGMGTVWLCQDEKLHRDVAVKQVGLLPGESVTDSARALREARTSAALSHRNVVTVFDVVEEDGHIWLVMEHVPGRSLSEIIRDEGRIPPEQVAEIGAQVAAGLASAHEAGTTHRDVKPGNVLVREDGIAKISDFGIARTAGDPALTQSGLFVGTPMYFSPELARGAEPAPPADVWALGATLYAAVEGRPPYEQRSNAMAVITEVANEPPAPPRHAGFLEPALTRMLDRDPASRWSMDDAAHALRQLADRHAEHTRSTSTALLAGAAGGGAAAGADAGAADPGRGRRGESTRTIERTEAAPASPPAQPPGPDRASGQPAGETRRRRPGALALLLGLVGLLLIGGIVYAAVNQTDEGSPQAGASGAQQGSDEPTQQDSPEPSTEPNATTKPSDAAKPPTSDGPGKKDKGDKPTPRAGGKPDGFVRDYYGTVPDDLDTGWSMLSPRMQSEVGRDSYDGFWGTIAAVQPSRLKTSPGGDSVDVTLRFTDNDGNVSVERHRIALVDGDGGYLIDDDQVIG
jgi:serine/threonine protein kinase